MACVHYTDDLDLEYWLYIYWVCYDFIKMLLDGLQKIKQKNLDN